MKNVKKWLAKLLVMISLIISISVGVSTGQVWASGVDVQQSSITVQGYTSSAPNGYTAIFPQASVNSFYSGIVAITVNSTANVQTGGSFLVELDASNDGTNWTSITGVSGVASGTHTFYFNLTGNYSYIRTVSNNSSISLTQSVASVSGLGADQQTAQTAANNATNAMNAANSANSAAQAAQNAATNAANGTNTIINSYLSTTAGVVQDGSGTVLNAARLAQTNALNAYNSANQADTDIKSAQTNLSSQITNNFNNLSQYLTPNLKKISGSNGATATSGSSMQLVLDYNNATDYRYSIDGGSWSGWSPLTGTTISVPLSTQGSHTIVVQIRNGLGSTAPTDQSSINVFKL